MARKPGFWRRMSAAIIYRCGASSRSWSFETLIWLNYDEEKECRALGHVYIDYLAARVSYWASEYQGRNLSQKMGSQVHEAVMEWRRIPGNEVS